MPERDLIPSPPSVIIVDDDPALRMTLKLILEMEGYSVESAADGVEALRKVAQQRGPTIIPLDLMMPVMDGFEFLKRLRELQAGQTRFPILVLSAADGRLLSDPRLKGVDRIIKKPFNVEELIKLIAEYFRTGHRLAA